MQMVPIITLAKKQNYPQILKIQTNQMLILMIQIRTVVIKILLLHQMDLMDQRVHTKIKLMLFQDQFYP
ncbi:hypothetical protein MIMI-R681 [Acanthamoeba polyphaga mimivirus]|uniref:Uncharacterized protein n=1 Tax=Acanthamoeba polyphaga mimivirus TaxID=212035 RepID=E5L7Y8_MIMIV|nr:hypothetical protein MIMI_gp0483 [Acanthamoeba polyphaga mimivirus]ADQ48140.1 hypothetical protein [Acanthamoeba polyphaga mimivirus]UTE96773.1 hypothetical protein MIMI-R681 [Acanthamoeba polyphaga mimivirus]